MCRPRETPGGHPPRRTGELGLYRRIGPASSRTHARSVREDAAARGKGGFLENEGGGFRSRTTPENKPETRSNYFRSYSMFITIPGQRVIFRRYLYIHTYFHFLTWGFAGPHPRRIP